ncbi:MAG: hypothetical protein ABSD71_13450 [Bacteroidales bacterium]|jgi:hypothetical protein
MKKGFINLLVIMLCSVTNVMAQYPIPSYNIDVTRTANFQEQSNLSMMSVSPMAKRVINVDGHCPNMPSASPCAEVWFYSLDQTNILGPYALYSDELLQIAIDTRSWGVYIEVSDEVYVSVWIDSGEALPLKRLF